MYQIHQDGNWHSIKYTYLVSFNVFIDPWSHYHRQDSERVYHPPKPPYLFFNNSLPPFLPLPNPRKLSTCFLQPQFAFYTMCSPDGKEQKIQRPKQKQKNRASFPLLFMLKLVWNIKFWSSVNWLTNEFFIKNVLSSIYLLHKWLFEMWICLYFLLLHL